MSSLPPSLSKQQPLAPSQFAGMNALSFSSASSLANPLVAVALRDRINECVHDDGLSEVVVTVV